MTDSVKEAKLEANQIRIKQSEKISELEDEVYAKDRELESLSSKLNEIEELLSIKDKHIAGLEKSLKELSDTEADINYFAELID